MSEPYGIYLLEQERSKLRNSQEFLLRTLAAVLINAGGEIVISTDRVGEAQLLQDPTIYTWCDPESLNFHIKLKKSEVPK